ncbi:MAG: PrsW family glutamic-type intramembrane protease [Bacteroidales bacterium]|nr:PrsW family glutamic-type intramembrane protease [Bacteroidales bacterium]MDD3431901.1 PrsW family glutamic-type intramembrane protease [Bacteroidales bacterium]MDD4361760.1 PrsW family glutamic-type intramembrane protease [Bacteroidales bacterium]MDD4430990.1 PrsW family glutamic-type intramembrane protease [Bacteroidales bacterium]
MNILISTLPVFLFLLFLFLLDSFKLVNKLWLLIAVLWGVFSAGLAYLLNTYLIEITDLDFDQYARYLAPIPEEIIKSLFVFWLILGKKAGFMIDAAIYGFAVGAGFALIENSLYLYNETEAGLLVAIIRGFGTAFMHGGCTALIAMILINAKHRNAYFLLNIFIAFAAAYFVHSAFNHFYIQPLLQTLGIVLFLPLVFVFIFNRNEKQLHNWLEMEFSSEMELLQAMKKGQLSQTRTGEYLAQLKSRFRGETILDMYCYIQLYLELSIRAKRNLMLKENGLPPVFEQDMSEKMNELQNIKKQIGKVGEMALAPLIRLNYRDLWKLNSLNYTEK